MASIKNCYRQFNLKWFGVNHEFKIESRRYEWRKRLTHTYVVFFCKNKTLKLLQEYVTINISGEKKTFRTDRQPELQWLISREKYADEMRFAWTAPRPFSRWKDIFRGVKELLLWNLPQMLRWRGLSPTVFLLNLKMQWSMLSQKVAKIYRNF